MKLILKKKVFSYKEILSLLSLRFLPYGYSSIKVFDDNKFLTLKELENHVKELYFFKNHKSHSSNFDEYISIFDSQLKKIFKKDTRVILMFSGGKDSAFIASRIKMNNLKCEYYSAFSNKNEYSVIKSVADALKIKTSFVKTSGLLSKVIEYWLDINEPILDPAIFNYIKIFHNIKKKFHNEKITILDGMGNDVYMGHLPSINDKRKKLISNLLPYKINKILNYSFGKFAQRPIYSNLPTDLIDATYIEKFLNLNHYIHSNPIYTRALFRGIHYDVSCGMGKTLAATSIFDGFSTDFPFFKTQLIDWYKEFNVSNHDFNDKENKLSIRSYLQHNYNYSNLFNSKGIFEPYNVGLLKFRPEQIRLLKNIPLKINLKRNSHRRDFYFWSLWFLHNQKKLS